MSKNRFLRSIMLLIVVVLTLSCVEKKQYEGARKEHITLMAWGKAAEIKTLSEFIKQGFEKQNPAIEVQVNHIPDSERYSQKVITMIAGGTPPDVIFNTNKWFSGFTMRNTLLDLSSLIKNDVEFKKEDIISFLWDAVNYKGGIYGIPFRWNSVALYYNKDAFDEAGVAYPDDSWTWGTFLKASQKLVKRDERGRIVRYGFCWPPYAPEGIWQLFVKQNGGEFYSKEENKYMLASPKYLQANIEAFQFLNDLVNKYQVAPSPREAREMRGMNVLEAGFSAMEIAGSWETFVLRNSKNLNWDIAPLPFKRRRAVHTSQNMLSIPKSSGHIAAAWKLIKFLLSDEYQIFVAESGRAIPAKKSIAYSEHFTKSPLLPPGKNRRVFLEHLEYKYDLTMYGKLGKERVKLISIEIEELEKMYLEQQSAAETISNIQRRAEELL